MTTHYDLTGKLALVTGASSGLGEHFAKTLAAQGATVVLAARRLEKLNALKQDIENDGGKAFAVRMDVTSLSSVEAAFAAIQSEFKRPCDTLINNSGVAHSSWFVDTDEEEWNAVIDTNLSGAWRVAKHAAKAMIADQQPGSIVNIASITGLRSSPMIAGYAASKAAVIHLTQNMALELARYQIRVNSISPGYFTTPINEDYLQTEHGQAMKKRIAMRRFGNHEDLNGPLLLLVSDAIAYMTGSNIVVDGGHTLTPL